jgi:enediyne biosynthesis protein E4
VASADPRDGPERARGSARSVLAVAAVTAIALTGVGLAAGAVRQEPPPAASEPPRFVDETAGAGVEHVYDGDFEFFVGGGLAVLDCDDDGRPDLYIAGGDGPAGLYRNESAVGGQLRFTRVADQVTDLEGTTGAYPLDVDGDGVTDLAVLRQGENVLLRGLGDCRFERANESWALDGGDHWTVGFSATWEPSAELPTLAFGNYLDATDLDTERATCADSALVRPQPGEATYGAPIPLTPGRCALSALFSDWDGTGRSDLRLSNDRHYDSEAEEQLWRVAEGEPPRLHTREDGWEQLRIWGMGIATHDLTGDGRPEVFLTSQGDNKLQRLREGADGPTYDDIAIRRGVTAHRPHAGGDVLPSTAWHAEFQDVNNDGIVDLFVAKGNVEEQPDHAGRDPNNLLIGQEDGTFVEGAEDAGIVHFERTRGAALVDLNLDGMLDLVEVNRREPVRVWRNLGANDDDRSAPTAGWLQLRLAQDGPNRDAIGSWIEVRTGDRVVRREVTVGGGHAGGQLGWIHVGLGDATRAEVRVRWPDGETGPWMGLDANAFATLERGISEPSTWIPPRR